MTNQTPYALLLGLAYKLIDDASKARAYKQFRLSCACLYSASKLFTRQLPQWGIISVPEREAGQDATKYDDVLINYYENALSAITEAISHYSADFFEKDDM